MDKYGDLGLEASKFIEDLNMYEASKDGLFRVDKGAGNNPEFEETRRVFATKMAKIHRQQQQQLLQDETLPRGVRGPVNGGGPPGPQVRRDAAVGHKLTPDGATKPPLAASTAGPGTATAVASGQPLYPPQDQRARPYVRSGSHGSQDCGSRESLARWEMSAFRQPGPCEDPSCLTHGDYYDNLSLASPKWADEPGVSPSIRVGVGSGWPGTPGITEAPLSKPSGDHPLYQPQLAPNSSQSSETGQDGGVGGRGCEKPAGLWTTASSQRVSPGLSSPGPENGALRGPTQPRTPSFLAPLAQSCPSQGALPRTNLGVGSEVSGTTPKPTVDPQAWFQDGPKSYLSSSSPSSSPASVDGLPSGAAPGLGPKPVCTDPGVGPKLSPTSLVHPVMSTPPELSCKEGPSGWSSDGSLGPGLRESPSPPRVRLPCQTLIPGPELGPSAAELKLEALTQRLEREMDGHPKADYFGACVKCSKGVFGAGQACQAMGNLYHDACFTCAACRNSSHCPENLAFLLFFGKVFWTLKFVMKSSSQGPIPFPE
ncbi:LIM domain-containing protein 1 isoform X2 [Herpailurus yagouaroundi]|uniref:LIM domain-containing protein 1 isoform X2 n=1 Tax=Herpailurus yagouaroundi TaxID=1608482 RepID=UPI001AD74EA1|nr:LIM domain-containing protein 1 isoform X2 [Puma yagouaroundi]